MMSRSTHFYIFDVPNLVLSEFSSVAALQYSLCVRDCTDPESPGISNKKILGLESPGKSPVVLLENCGKWDVVP